NASAQPTNGTLGLCGSGGGCATVAVPASFTSFNFNLPASSGASGNLLLSGGGGGSAMTWGTRTGNTTAFASVAGSITSGGCAQWDANGNLTSLASACGSGGGGGVTTGTVPQLAYYSTTTTVASAANTAIGDGTANPILSLTGTSLAKESLFVNCTTPTA